MKALPEDARRAALRMLASLTLVWVAVAVFLYAMQGNFIFFPPKEVTARPQDFGCAAEEVRFAGVSAFWVPAAEGGPRALIFSHGNASNIGHNAERACGMSRLGFSVLAYDYRGYGRSDELTPSEASVFEDAEAAWQFVRERGFEPGQIVLYGQSLGGAVAVEQAARHPDAAGLIVESSFTSVYDLSRGELLYRLFPIRLILKHRFDSAEKLRGIRMPAVFIHGTRDRVIAPEMSRRLYELAHEPKKLVWIEGAGHDDCAESGGAVYAEALRSMLGERAASPQPEPQSSAVAR